jgi:hypothetical protein
MNDKNTPTRSSNMEKAEGDRDTAQANRDVDYGNATPEGGGITNRPLEEEVDNQERLPDRGDTKGGAHAG